jgi:hypothetical protein
MRSGRRSAGEEPVRSGEREEFKSRPLIESSRIAPGYVPLDLDT